MDSAGNHDTSDTDDTVVRYESVTEAYPISPLIGFRERNFEIYLWLVSIRQPFHSMASWPFHGSVWHVQDANGCHGTPLISFSIFPIQTGGKP
jgi:hypothetical protein